MEFLLLWIDDLDDAFCALRHIASEIIGFLVALVLFVGTAFVFARMPADALNVLALILSASLVEFARRRRRIRIAGK